MCDPAHSSGGCRSCGGGGRVPLFEIPAGAWGSTEPPDGSAPCAACVGSGLCPTCQGLGALDDEAWEDALVQPYL